MGIQRVGFRFFFRQFGGRILVVSGIVTLTLAKTGCGLFSTGLSLPDLPDSSTLGSMRGYRIARTITHFHSPYSWDACDGNGMPGGTLNASCLADLKEALCRNRIDFTFLSDHPANMVNYEMQDLLIPGTKDSLLSHKNVPYANVLGSCANSFSPTLYVGFESLTEMALGMENQLVSNPAQRNNLYNSGTLALRQQLASGANAIVAVPHTESKTISWIESIQPDAVEIYNFHANLDPKIRQQSLGLPPFSDLPGVITYLVDPFHQMVPDLGFLSFLKVSPIYFQMWDTLIQDGYKVTGIGGTDSHENVLPIIVSDGERMDAHRRIARMMSNHFLVQNMTTPDIKNAIKAGRGWVVFEGLGSPQGMDFYATTGGTTINVGETASIQNGLAQVEVKCPSLNSQSPQGSESPIITINIKRVLPGGTDQVVATAQGMDLQFNTGTSGAYRAEISIIPKHLKNYLGDFSNLGDQSYLWIITNHIYLN